MAQDLAGGIYPGEEIAARYKFADKAELKLWIAAHPEFLAYVMRLKALNDSDDNVNERIKQKAAHATENSLHVVHGIVQDPSVPAAVRLDAFKVQSKLGGAEAYVQAPKEGPGGGAGQVLNFAINFAGLPPQIISTTVVDPASIPDLSENQSDGDEPEEDA